LLHPTPPCPAQDLDLSSNKLGDAGGTVLATALRDNRALLRLRLADCSLGVDALQLLATAIEVNTTLTHLDVSGNNPHRNAGVMSLCCAVGSNTGLRTLNIADTGMRTDGAVTMAAALRTNRYLRQLYMQENRVESRGVEALAGALTVNGVLEVLDLECNHVTYEGGEAMGRALKVRAVAYLSGKLSEGNARGRRKGYTYVGCRNMCTRAMAAVQPYSYAHSTSSPPPRTPDAPVRPWILLPPPLPGSPLPSRTQTNTGLRVLSLWDNGVGDKGLLAIAAGLQENSTLIALNLDFNGITSGGA